MYVCTYVCTQIQSRVKCELYPHVVNSLNVTVIIYTNIPVSMYMHTYMHTCTCQTFNLLPNTVKNSYNKLLYDKFLDITKQ